MRGSRTSPRVASAIPRAGQESTPRSSRLPSGVNSPTLPPTNRSRRDPGRPMRDGGDVSPGGSLSAGEKTQPHVDRAMIGTVKRSTFQKDRHGPIGSVKNMIDRRPRQRKSPSPGEVEGIAPDVMFPGTASPQVLKIGGPRGDVQIAQDHVGSFPSAHGASNPGELSVSNPKIPTGDRRGGVHKPTRKSTPPVSKGSRPPGDRGSPGKKEPGRSKRPFGEHGETKVVRTHAHRSMRIPLPQRIEVLPVGRTNLEHEHEIGIRPGEIQHPLAKSIDPGTRVEQSQGKISLVRVGGGNRMREKTPPHMGSQPEKNQNGGREGHQRRSPPPRQNQCETQKEKRRPELWVEMRKKLQRP